MRFREVFRYEIAYRFRSGSTWVYALFLFFAMFLRLSGGRASDAVPANAPQQLTEVIALFGGLFGMLVSAAIFCDAATRDAAAGMEPLVYTTRLRKIEYLAGRFLAALTANAVLVLALPIGFFVASTTIVHPDALGPQRVAAYVQPLLLFVWPNLILVGAIQFTIGALARRAIPVYAGTAAVFVGYVVAANYWGDIQSRVLSALADPFGINGFLAMTRYWTPVELGTRLVGFPPMLVLNRLAWLAIAAVVLGVLHRSFRFAHAGDTGRRRRRPAAGEPVDVRWYGTVRRVPGVFGRSTGVRQTLAIARESWVEIVSGRGFQIGLLATIGLVLLWGWNVGDTLFETSTWPVTHLVVEEVLSRRAPFIPWLVIALYSGELVWTHRERGTAEIADAMPVSTGIALLGRFLALVAVIAMFQAMSMIGGLLLQALQGYFHFEPGLYVRVLFGLNFIDLVLLAACAMTIHVLVNQKYVGYILVLAASAFRVGGPMMGIHRLIVYGSDPGWRYSDMNGFGPFLTPFLWFKGYWASWALLLAVIAILFWVRGTELGVRHRISVARARASGATLRMAGAALALVLLVGGFVYFNTNVLNAYRGRGEYDPSQADYERRYGAMRTRRNRSLPTRICASRSTRTNRPSRSAAPTRW